MKKSKFSESQIVAILEAHHPQRKRDTVSLSSFCGRFRPSSVGADSARGAD